MFQEINPQAVPIGPLTKSGRVRYETSLLLLLPSQTLHFRDTWYFSHGEGERGEWRLTVHFPNNHPPLERARAVHENTPHPPKATLIEGLIAQHAFWIVGNISRPADACIETTQIEMKVRRNLFMGALMGVHMEIRGMTLVLMDCWQLKNCVAYRAFTQNCRSSTRTPRACTEKDWRNDAAWN